VKQSRPPSAVKPSEMKTPARKIWKFLGSLKLAVVLLVMLAAILATATFYESLYDTKTAQHLVYSSPWFAVFLGLLFTNVFCSAASRYPIKATRQALSSPTSAS